MSKTEISKYKIDQTDPRELDKLKRELKSKDKQRGVAGGSKTIALALSPSVSPSRRTAKNRRQDLAGFVNSLEATVRSRLRALELPEEFTDLQKYLSKVPSELEHRLDAMRTKEWKRAYDLLCCLACIRKSRQLLKRRETEGVAVQAYYLGFRAAMAGARQLEAMGLATTRAQATSRQLRSERSVARLQLAQEFIDELYRQKPEYWDFGPLCDKAKKELSHKPKASYLLKKLNNPKKRPLK